jgi:N6-adenosine-specific RNA methylase IME4
MELGELRELGTLIRRACDTECWLFLWVIGSFLPEGLSLMREWGFRYSSIGLSWMKLNPSGEGLWMGPGQTTRHNIELCLLGRRGKPPRNSAGVREAILESVREHSRKPDVYDRIEQFCDGPRLELFARNSRPGWTSIGNELQKF